jgi:hypothetical protein
MSQNERALDHRAPTLRDRIGSTSSAGGPRDGGGEVRIIVAVLGAECRRVPHT